MNLSSKLMITSSVLGIFCAAGCGPAKTNVRSAVNDPSTPTSGALAADQMILTKRAAPIVSPTNEAKTETSDGHPNARPVSEPATDSATDSTTDLPTRSETQVAESEKSESVVVNTQGASTTFSSGFKDASGHLKKRSATTLDCLKRAIATLKKYSPSGYRTYQRVQDKTVFETFIGDCRSDEEFYLIDLPTAVHESNHLIRAETEAYHFVTDEMLKVPAASGYFPPSEIGSSLVAHLKVKDDFYKTYLAPTADASSKTDFTYLLDELAAYTIDFQVANDMTQVVPLTQRQVGLPALMTFVSFYATYAHVKHPDVWNQMETNPEMKSALTKLWVQAETSLLTACQKGPDPAGVDTHYIKHLCDAKQMSSIATIIGHKTVCPSACH